MRIPYDQLSPAALRGLVEEFVTRDGTDLIDANRKVEQVLAALRAGRVVIEFDEEEGTTTIVPVDPPSNKRPVFDA